VIEDRAQPILSERYNIKGCHHAPVGGAGTLRPIAPTLSRQEEFFWYFYFGWINYAVWNAASTDGATKPETVSIYDCDFKQLSSKVGFGFHCG
jgi:hypothetical protein